MILIKFTKICVLNIYTHFACITFTDQKGKRKMWERDLKTFADDYNFVSLEFTNESADSTVADGVDVAKVCT